VFFHADKAVTLWPEIPELGGKNAGDHSQELAAMVEIEPRGGPPPKALWHSNAKGLAAG
jgi:hypothetical protein